MRTALVFDIKHWVPAAGAAPCEMGSISQCVRMGTLEDSETVSCIIKLFFMINSLYFHVFFWLYSPHI